MANGSDDIDTIQARVHQAVFGFLIDQIRTDPFPSTTMMDIVETGMGEDDVEAYADVLLEKVSGDRFPSLDMVNRLLRLT
jgi:hypothetical protein